MCVTTNPVSRRNWSRRRCNAFVITSSVNISVIAGVESAQFVVDGFLQVILNRVE